MARLYSNENFPLPVVEELRRLGHEVVTIQETGRGEMEVPDTEVLRLASEDGRAVLTINRKHFIQLHHRQPQHAGVIVCTLDLDFVGQAQRIHEAINASDDLAGELIRVNRPNP